ncbi:MAG TPA: alcohol dehydrogenase [Pelotomaculum sp.]|nr:alcohol dehydrogenase [Pelotomaculum sp.]
MNFRFSVPSTVLFGSGVSQTVGEEAKKLGMKKALVVIDPGLKAAGIADKIESALSRESVAYVVFDRVEPNPSDSIVEQGAILARKEKVDGVIGVGGGSAMDVGKAINVLLTNPSPINQYDGLGLLQNPPGPMIAIPTTAGTGSEVTEFCVITDTKRIKKMVIGPNTGATLALVDPDLTVGLPPAVTAATGLDALTHAIEAYVSVAASIPSDILALEAVRIISRNIKEATNNGVNLEAREAMILGSMIAGYAFNNAVLGLAHSMAHPLSAHCGIPHGVANAICLPYVLEYNIPAATKKIADIALAMGAAPGGTDEEVAQRGVRIVRDMCAELKIPRLSECGVSEELFQRLSEDALNEVSTLFNPRKPTLAEILELYKKAY